MAGPSWLVDSNRIATKIRSASGAIDPKKVDWKSNPTRTCPTCQHVIDNSDVVQLWPGLPQGVKFDPSDQEIIWHLLAKNGCEGFVSHPFINEFIPTVNEDVGICYTHPQNLPGVKQDGGGVHFFHRAIKAYNTGTRKRRKILDNDADVRWHKTGRTKPVILDGVQKGCKKIMVLYTILAKGGKSEKTNWVMHQYHLGTDEDEKDGEYVISKILFQQQQLKQGEKSEQDIMEYSDTTVVKVDPVTPKSVTSDPPRNDLGHSCATSLAKSVEMRNVDAEVEVALDVEVPPMAGMALDVNVPPDVEVVFDVDVSPEVEVALDVDVPPEVEVVRADCDVQFNDETDHHENVDGIDNHTQDETDHHENVDGIDNHTQDDPKWWDSESQNLLDSQQLVEGLTLCDEFLASQSPDRDGSTDDEKLKNRSRFSDYAHLGSEDPKKDLEECQKLVLDPANIELDTPPEFRLSQLEFGSQDSYLAWGVGEMGN